MAVQFNKGRALHLFELTPMIDMLFALLMFFMVCSQFAIAERNMHVELPSGSAALPLTAKPKEIFINIDRSGRYFVHGREIHQPELAVLLRTAATDNPANQAVVIRADKRAAWDFVATAMRLCNQAGIRDYSASLADEP
jgi:biopolymer transport protein ExbD